MEKLGLNEIRQMFQDFYVSKGHYPGKSASLIPKNDKSLLIINSGMAPLKPFFSGKEIPPAKRMTTCQKCIRTGDIDNVGITSRHGTFFEMLGNFSFGDYFKKESLTWGWEFITEWLKMPADKIWATVYEEDEQAVEIWKEIGLPEERIVRLGKDDNFWEIGLGPCGPCSEIFFDRGEEYGCGSPDCKPGCECDRFLEFWNHVFTQFSKEEDGSYSNLDHPNIDTGMGLERMACIMQGVDSIFDIDTVRHILNGVTDLCDVDYEVGNKENDISIRIITDHLRSMVFMIADGIKPSNEGRGYVLRRLIRRASMHGRKLGISGKFLCKLCDKVIEVSGEAYPEIVEKQDLIKMSIEAEENRFAQTIDRGMEIIDEYCEELKSKGESRLSGDNAFKLHDTYGFPLELTDEILGERGYSVDHEGFDTCMQQQQTKGREGRKDVSAEAWKGSVDTSSYPATEFTGYDKMEDTGNVLAIFKKSREIEIADEGSEVLVVLNRTPFYGEGGGQASDIGYLYNNKFESKVIYVSKQNDVYLHKIQITKGNLAVSDKVRCNVNIFKRNATARNHTTTHLLQKALQEILGSHVEQAGSSVDENGLRFDFTHFEAMSDEQIKDVERLVNQKITEFLPVRTKVTDIETAQSMGAMALFGEKYGDSVRVVSCGDWSMELCGGTHVFNTGQIGAFKITGESGTAAGVRRIEGVTGTGILVRCNAQERQLNNIARIVKANPNQLTERIQTLSDELRDAKKDLEEFKKQSMDSGLDDMLASAKQINDIRLITKQFDDYNIADLRSLSDEVKKDNKGIVMVFAAVNEGKVTLLVSVTDDLVDKGIHAGKMIKEIAASCGGGGGGKANMAQAGAKDSSKIPDAFKVAEQLLS